MKISVMNWGMILTGENRNTWREICSNATLFTTNLTWIGLRTNVGLGGEKSASHSWGVRDGRLHPGFLFPEVLKKKSGSTNPFAIRGTFISVPCLKLKALCSFEKSRNINPET
jgi:hypothetical protein